MKKTLFALLASVAVVGLFGCGDSTGSSDSDQPIKNGTYQSKELGAEDFVMMAAPSLVKAMVPQATQLALVASATPLPPAELDNGIDQLSSLKMRIEIEVDGDKMLLSMSIKMPPFIPEFDRSMEMKGKWKVVDSFLYMSDASMRQKDPQTNVWGEWEKSDLDEGEDLDSEGVAIRNITKTSFELQFGFGDAGGEMVVGSMEWLLFNKI